MIKLLERLRGVRPRGEGRWSALCPAHEDREPSLSLRELADGTVLLKCFAGCSAPAVVEAVGLKICDLFPPRIEEGRRSAARYERPALTVGELVTLLRYHTTLIMIAAEDIAAGRVLSPSDIEAARRAASRLHRILDLAGNG